MELFVFFAGFSPTFDLALIMSEFLVLKQVSRGGGIGGD